VARAATSTVQTAATSTRAIVLALRRGGRAEADMS
jgi:hypothetical protein